MISACFSGALLLVILVPTARLYAWEAATNRSQYNITETYLYNGTVKDPNLQIGGQVDVFGNPSKNTKLVVNENISLSQQPADDMNSYQIAKKAYANVRVNEAYAAYQTLSSSVYGGRKMLAIGKAMASNPSNPSKVGLANLTPIFQASQGLDTLGAGYILSNNFDFDVGVAGGKFRNGFDKEGFPYFHANMLSSSIETGVTLSEQFLGLELQGAAGDSTLLYAEGNVHGYSGSRSGNSEERSGVEPLADYVLGVSLTIDSLSMSTYIEYIYNSMGVSNRGELPEDRSKHYVFPIAENRHPDWGGTDFLGQRTLYALLLKSDFYKLSVASYYSLDDSSYLWQVMTLFGSASPTSDLKVSLNFFGLEGQKNTQYGELKQVYSLGVQAKIIF